MLAQSIKHRAFILETPGSNPDRKPNLSQCNTATHPWSPLENTLQTISVTHTQELSGKMEQGKNPSLLAILLLTLATATQALKPLLSWADDARFKRSDDTLPMETVVEQQAALIQKLLARVRALETDTAAVKSRQQTLSSPGKH